MLKNPNPTSKPQTNLRFPDSNPHQADGAFDISGQFHGLGEDVDQLGPGSPAARARAAETSQAVNIATGAEAQ